MIVPKRTGYRPRFVMRRGLGAVTDAQLKAIVSGQQPSFITGLYPNASWNSYNDFNNGYGVYLPYSTAQIIANGPANQNYVYANQNVQNQFSALLEAANPIMAEALYTGGPVTAPPAVANYQAQAQTMVNNGAPVIFNGVQYQPGDTVPAAPVAAPAATPISASAPVASPVYASSADGSTPSGTYNTTPAASSFDLSSIPWWGWAAAAVGLFMVVK
jgi:hypothetical protein